MLTTSYNTEQELLHDTPLEVRQKDMVGVKDKIHLFEAEKNSYSEREYIFELTKRLLLPEGDSKVTAELRQKIIDQVIKPLKNYFSDVKSRGPMTDAEIAIRGGQHQRSTRDEFNSNLTSTSNSNSSTSSSSTQTQTQS